MQVDYNLSSKFPFLLEYIVKKSVKKKLKLSMSLKNEKLVILKLFASSSNEHGRTKKLC